MRLQCFTILFPPFHRRRLLLLISIHMFYYLTIKRTVCNFAPQTLKYATKYVRIIFSLLSETHHISNDIQTNANIRQDYRWYCLQYGVIVIDIGRYAVSLHFICLDSCWKRKCPFWLDLLAFHFSACLLAGKSFWTLFHSRPIDLQYK